MQLKRGQRFSTDDTATAWLAATSSPTARRLLDLGCGIGSVGLLTLWKLDNDATLVGIEAQETSLELLGETLALNGLEERVRVVLGDLRESSLLEVGARFDLITGTPPYIPLGHGVVSPVPQRAAARMELRGSIFDYCEAARRWLAPGGRFCFAMASRDLRTEEAPLAHGLTVLGRRDWIFRHGAPPLVSTLVCARDEDGPHPERWQEQVVVRGPDGRWTEEYEVFRKQMGAP